MSSTPTAGRPIIGEGRHRAGPRPIVDRLLPRTSERISASLICMGLGILWVRPIGSSFWLDELGTYWVVRGDLPRAVDLAMRYQGQSPAYYVIAWVARTVGGKSEIALRLPSLAAALAATLLVASLGRRLFGAGAGWASAVAFAATPIVAFSAIDARPYAFAYLSLAAATVFLVQLADRGDRRSAVAYGASVAATIHFHLLFAFALLGHLPFLARRWQGMSSSARRRLLVSATVAAVLLVPLAAQLPHLVAHARLPNLPLGSPSFDGLLRTLVPVTLVAGVVLGWVLARAAGPVDLRATAAEGALALSASLWLAPSVGLLLLSAASGLNLLWPTYARSSAMGWALLLGGATAAARPERARRIALMALVTVVLLADGGRPHGGQDWRGAAATVDRIVDDPRTPVLMHAAFIEGANVRLLEDPGYRDALLAQRSRYPVEGMIVPVPYNLSPQAQRYLERRVLPRVETSERFILVTLEGIAPIRVWLEARLAPVGFVSREIEEGEHGSVEVTLFERKMPYAFRVTDAIRDPGIT